MSAAREYTQTFFITPYRIMQLPDLTLAFLRFYETIFQFFNNGKTCYLSNEMIKERTGISSSSTIQEAFEYFESHGELKRVVKDGRRYIVQPQQKIQIDDQYQPVDNSPQKDPTPLAVARPPSRCSETPPLAVARHKINKINIKNIREREDKENIDSTEARTSLSDSFVFNNEVQELAAQVSERVGISVQDLATKFRLICAERKKISADWNASAKKFLMDERAVFKSDKVANINQVARAPIQEWGPGHASWESLHGNYKPAYV